MLFYEWGKFDQFYEHLRGFNNSIKFKLQRIEFYVLDF
jgi:hypothetical protein